jgi:hypothetical protein
MRLMQGEKEKGGMRIKDTSSITKLLSSLTFFNYV